MHLATAINRRYVFPLQVLAASIFRHLKVKRKPVLFLIHTDLTQQDLDLLAPFVEVRPIVPSPAQLARIPSSVRYPGVLSCPAILPDLLPAGLDRVLFLDADLLALDDLTPLYLTGHATAPVSAVQDLAIPFLSSPRGLPKGDALPAKPYFNCGVLLIRPVLWKEQDVSRRCIEYLEKRGDEARFFHQEALNVALMDGWHALDARWNVIASVATHDSARAPSCPALVHFAGRIKPWLSPMAGTIGGAYRDALSDLGLKPQWTLKSCLLSGYDQWLRPMVYPLEYYLWRRNIL